MICNNNSELNSICTTCNKKIFHDYKLRKYEGDVFYAYSYSGYIRKLIIDYKFNDKKELYQVFGEIYLKILKDLNINNSILIFVPSYMRTSHLKPIQKYLKMKGFNIFSGVKKIKKTKKQIELNKKERKVNLKGAFKLTKKLPHNKKIIIIDDVVTTKSTFNAVKNAIGKDCIGIMLAHGD